MKRFLIAFVLVFSLFSCGRTPQQHEATPYNLDNPYRFPTTLNIPDDNPMTEEGVELGRTLFYDGRLSGRTAPDSMMSCATCHKQQYNFTAGSGDVCGMSGVRLSHMVMPLTNLVWNMYGYGWNGSVNLENENPNQRNIEDIVRNAVLDVNEIGGDTNAIKTLLGSLDGYPEMFAKAFGTPEVTFERIELAVAQFVRSLVSGDSRFDRYLRGEAQLSPSELNGYVLFITEEGADCFHCHGGGGNPLFTTHLWYNNGLDSVTDDPHDRYGYTGNPADRGSYKAPSLRNVEVSAPYMHDGRFATLDEVIGFYSSGVQMSENISPLMHHAMQGGVMLTESERADLKAFLLTLTDTTFLNNKQHSRPERFPDE